MTSSQAASITKSVANTNDFLTECIDEGSGKTEILDSKCSNLLNINGNMPVELADATTAMKPARAHKRIIAADDEERKKGAAKPLLVHREQQPVSRGANDQLRVAITKTIVISKTT